MPLTALRRGLVRDGLHGFPSANALRVNDLVFRRSFSGSSSSDRSQQQQQQQQQQEGAAFARRVYKLVVLLGLGTQSHAKHSLFATDQDPCLVRIS